MGRPVKSENLQSLKEEWSRRLRAVAWSTGGSASDLKRLTKIISRDPDDLDAASRAKLRDAAIELAAAISADGSESAGCRNALGRWVVNRLLTRGSQLLIPEQRRVQLLARQRDMQAQQTKLKKGLRAATVTMSQTAWSKLEAIRCSGATHTSSSVTLGAAIERLINEHHARCAGSHAKAAKKRRAAAPIDRTLDLFKALPQVVSAKPPDGSDGDAVMNAS